MNPLGGFWHYATRVFDLPMQMGAVGDERQWPTVPTVAVFHFTLQEIARQLDLAMEHAQQLEPLRGG